MRAPTSNGTRAVPPGVHDEGAMAERRCLAKGSMALLDRAARPRGRPSATRAGGDPAALARRSEGSGRTAYALEIVDPERENALTFSNPVLVERTESELINTG